MILKLIGKELHANVTNNMTSTGLLILFLALTTIYAQNLCPDRSICINIRNCPAVISFLRSRPLSAKEMEMLRNSQCGYEGINPKICCNQVIITITTTTTMTTTVEPEIETPDLPDVTNHPNLRLLDHQACGPILGWSMHGNKTEIFQYPWMTLIAYDTGKLNLEFLCGGTIISSRYVLTAAHCVTSLSAHLKVTSVRIGDHDISKERDCIKDIEGVEILCAERYQDFGIDNIHPHPKYERIKMRNDIALIRLNGTVDFRSRNVKPICLPFGTAAILNHKKAIVTGWGATEMRDPRSQDLLQTRLPLVTNKQCKEIYEEVTQIWYKQLCAGGRKDVHFYSGDSGGPLQTAGIYNGRSVRIIQHGVVSFGVSFGVEGIPGIYTRVSYYMDWILDTMTD